MARSYAKVKGSIWRDEDWCSLPTGHQRLYLLLVSQPDITNCGVIPYLPGRWARLAADTTVSDVEQTAAALQDARFIVVDTHTCEVLVRTFVKHDQVLEQPKIRAAAVRQYDGIQSARIRTALATEYPDVFELTPQEQPHPEPYGKATANPSERVPDTLSPRARAASGNRQPSTGSPQPAAHQQQPAPTADEHAAAAINTLEQAGWIDTQIAAAAHDPLRAAAWLQHCQNDPTSTNPAGLAWAKFDTSHDWPNPPRPDQTTIANGAQGTRSTSPPLKRQTQPLPERTPPPEEALTALRKAGITIDDPEPQP